MSSIDQKTKYGLFWQTIMQPLWELIRFVLSIWITRLLEPTDYGIMGVASIIILYSNSLSELGFSNALIHKRDIEQKHLDTVFTVNFCISIFLMLAMCLLSNPISVFFKVQELDLVLKVLSIVFILTSFSQISIVLLKKELEYKRYTIIIFVKGLIQILTTLILAFMHYNYWALTFGMVVGEFFGAVILFFNISLRPRIKFHKDAFKSIYNYGFWNFLIAQFYTIHMYAEKAIIGKYLGAATLGLYDKAFYIAYMPVESISMKINGVMFASFNKYKSDEKEMCKAFYNVSVLSSLICFPILGGLIVVAHDFVQIAFGDKWVPMSTALAILSLAFIFRVPIGMMSSLNMAAGDYKKYIKFQILIYSTAIAAYFPFVSYGLESICIIILVTNFTLFISSVYLSKIAIKEMSLTRYLASLLPATVNTVVMVLSVLIADQTGIMNTLNMFTAFVSKVMIGIFVYLILFFSIKYESTELIRKKINNFHFR